MNRDNATINFSEPVQCNSNDISQNSSINAPLLNSGYLHARKSRITKNIHVDSSSYISSNYESLDYDVCENNLFLDEERAKGYKYIVKKSIARWIIFILIGMFTAFVACFVDIAIELLSDMKYKSLKNYIDYGVKSNVIYIPYLIWIGYNVVPVLIGSILIAYVEPVALGSGIPLIKCYLNGIKIPHVVRFKTLVVKSIGVITTVVGGLAGGKEGPMIHSGAVIAAGISQGKSTTFQKDFGLLKYFREDHEKRDFVSGGAAAGVAAAFGAPVAAILPLVSVMEIELCDAACKPVYFNLMTYTEKMPSNFTSNIGFFLFSGGVLFSLEEGASFWNQSLTWRIMVASMVSTFTLNIILSTYHGYPGKLSYPGLLNFGQFQNLSYEFYELIIFVLMGAFGGLTGALFNHINYKLTIFRIKYLKQRYLKVLEAVMVAVVSAVIPFLLIYYLNDCKPLSSLNYNVTKYPVRMQCSEDEYNAVAALFLEVPESSVRSIFHDSVDSLDTRSVIVFVVAYYLLSVYTYGISVSAGLFIPSLLIGATWGRLCGIFLQHLLPDVLPVCVGKYSLIGAAAQLGGIVRMTISLTVILIEATGDVTFGLPLLITLMTAKWVGDFFNEGLYDLHIQLSGIPLIAWEPPPLSSNIYASEIMNHPVVTFKTVENVGRVMDILLTKSYNGFPVVDPLDEAEVTSAVKPKSCGHLRGLILRSQLIVLLQNKIFNESADIWDVEYSSLKLFRSQYPRYPEIKDVHLTEEELRYTVNLRPFMNPSPYVVQYMSSLPRVFRLFRALGLRHLIVINDINQVVGMITRKDLARYKVRRHYGTIDVEELKISDQL